MWAGLGGTSWVWGHTAQTWEVSTSTPGTRRIPIGRRIILRASPSTARARNPAGTVVHSNPGSQFRSHRFVEGLRHHGLTGLHGQGWCVCGQRRDGVVLFAAAKRTSWSASAGSTGRTSGWPSCRGSGEPATVGDGKDAWENSRLSNMKQPTGTRSHRPKTLSQRRPGQAHVPSKSSRWGTWTRLATSKGPVTQSHNWGITDMECSSLDCLETEITEWRTSCK